MTPEVEVHLTVADRAPLLKQAKSGVGFIRYMPILVCMPVLLVAIPAGWAIGTDFLHMENTAAAVFGAALAYAVYILLYRRLCAIVVRRNFAADGSFFEAKRFSAQPDGLHAQSKSYHMIAFWPSIRRIVDTPTHLLMMTDVSQGYVVPKRCFPDANAVRAFVDAVRLYTGKPAP